MNTQAAKAQQVTNLLQYFPNIVCEQQFVVYSIPLKVSGFPNAALKITLPPQFPYVGPSLQILNMSHKLANENGFILTNLIQDLHHWSMSQNLGRVVWSIVTELQKVDLSVMSNSIYVTQPRAPMPLPVPAQPALLDFQEINTLSANDIREVLASQARFDEFAETTQHIQRLNARKNDTTKRVAAIEDRMAHLQNDREQVTIAQQELRNQFDFTQNLYNEKLKVQQHLMQKYSPANLVAFLADQSGRYETTCDDLVTDFQEGKTELDPFITNYLNNKTQQHLNQIRKADLERR